MNHRLTDSRLGNLGATALYDAFVAYQMNFTAVTRRAQTRFVNQEWAAAQADAAERLDIYKRIVDSTVNHICQLLAERVQDKVVWVSMKAVYSALIEGRHDWELAETFFNSVTRRIFTTVGVDPQIEFVDTDFESPPTTARQSVYRTYEAAKTADFLLTILRSTPFQAQFEDIQRDAHLAATRIESHLRQLGLPSVTRAEMIKPVFYRNKGAYLVGRLVSGAQHIPLVLALVNTPQGILVDAVLLTETEMSILFSFTHSYFQVEVERPHDLIQFIQTVIPRKKTAELYISLGYNKHGKTELYRDLLHHLAATNAQFEVAPGAKGMVMTVFAMPGYDYVFKLIKDRFAYPKTNTRQGVKAKYQMVFKHDRAGRLIDVQEFEHLQFGRSHFTESLLAELGQVASQSVGVNGDTVTIHHAYVERRITPLDIYIREAGETAVHAAIIDYGRAIKDLAATNIYPGDTLLKNFGVTRHGRVIFYDYDEICFVTDCRFRHLPTAPTYEDELSDQPWFPVAENDIFPAELARFLGLPAHLRQLFTEHHANLFEVDFWHEMQTRHQTGEMISIFPYREASRITGM